jgi:hypothetical protein
MSFTMRFVMVAIRKALQEVQSGAFTCRMLAGFASMRIISSPFTTESPSLRVKSDFEIWIHGLEGPFWRSQPANHASACSDHKSCGYRGFQIEVFGGDISRTKISSTGSGIISSSKHKTSGTKKHLPDANAFLLYFQWLLN